MCARNHYLRIALIVLLTGGLTGCPCQLIDGPGEPFIEFTFVPQLNTSGNLSGRVHHVETCEYAVAVYIFVGRGWWNKPTWDEPTVPIRWDGSWTADITTGGVDETATKIAAFLVPAGYALPLLSGASDLPDRLFEEAIAHVAVERSTQGLTRLLFFSGYEWWVKTSDTPVGPGPNLFSDSSDNAWVDGDGQLHLKITKKDSAYETAEIVSKDSFGFGTYIFHLTSRVDQLDPNVVLGFFTWSDDPTYHYREIDIEFSRWQDSLSDIAQYVVQPWDTPGNLERFNLGPEEVTTHGFTWGADKIRFQSVVGDDFLGAESGSVIHQWLYAGNDVPVPSGENTRINLWHVWGDPPTDGQETEVVISGFEFTSAPMLWWPLIQ